MKRIFLISILLALSFSLMPRNAQEAELTWEASYRKELAAKGHDEATVESLLKAKIKELKENLAWLKARRIKLHGVEAPTYMKAYHGFRLPNGSGKDRFKNLSYSQLATLKKLDLSGLFLDRSVYSRIGSLSELEALDLSWSNLSFSFKSAQMFKNLKKTQSSQKRWRELRRGRLCFYT